MWHFYVLDLRTMLRAMMQFAGLVDLANGCGSITIVVVVVVVVGDMGIQLWPLDRTVLVHRMTPKIKTKQIPPAAQPQEDQWQ